MKIETVEQLKSILHRANVPVHIDIEDFNNNIIENGGILLFRSSNNKKVNIDLPSNIFKSLSCKKIEIDLYTSKVHRQAVITLREPDRKYVIPTKFFHNKKNLTLKQFKDRVISKSIKDYLVDNPYKNPVFKKSLKDKVTDVYEVSVTLLKSTNCFLFGIDEKYAFISHLPTTTNSVRNAHKILRPNVSNKAIRVGEWFFDPISNSVDFSNIGTDITTSIEYITSRLEQHSTHMIEGISMRIDKDWYVLGNIIDTSKRHKDVKLNSFHRVVRNNERINTSGDYD